jgi:subfamily B ATP-binding cassette protein HlyB/CyaB
MALVEVDTALNDKIVANDVTETLPTSPWAALSLLAATLGVALEGRRLAAEAGWPDVVGPNELVGAAKRAGLSARAVKTRWSKLPKVPLPALALMRDGSVVVLAKVEAERVLVMPPGAERPIVQAAPAFLGDWSGRLVLVSKPGEGAATPHSFAAGWFARLAAKYKRLFSEVLLASVLLQTLGLISPLLFQVVIDKVLVHRSLTTLDVMVIGMVLVSLFEGLLGALRSYLLSHTTHRLDAELGGRMFGHLLDLPLGYFAARRVGDIAARVKELEGVRGFLTGSALTLMVDGTFTLIFFAVMWMFSPLLTGIVLASLPVYVLVSAVITPLLKKRLEVKGQRQSENQAFLIETLGAIETAKSMAIEPRLKRQFEEQLASSTEAAFKAGQISQIGSALVGGIGKIVTVILLWVGATAVIDGHLSVGQLIAFNMLASRVAQPILRLSQVWQEFQQMRVSVSRLAEVMDQRTEAVDRGGRSMPATLHGRVTFQEVDFRYRPNGPLVLSGVSVEIPAGQVVGIVGASGSSKSTFARLSQRLFTPERGRVLVDGIDIAQVDSGWLRAGIGTVPQEAVLFNRTVRENIALADPSASLARVADAAMRAGIHETILGLPNGYDTPVGERGATLSAGQRQRIALARALIRNPKLLILDEATSALDSESELLIQRSLKELCQGRTVLMIAHRLSTLRWADRILVIDGGKIVEDGSPAELSSNPGGRFAQLLKAQASMDTEPLTQGAAPSAVGAAE